MMNASRAKMFFLIAAGLAVGTTVILAIIFPYSTDPLAKVVWYKQVPGFAAMLGFAGCMLMVPLVKTFAKKFLLRPDEYYAPFEDRLGVMVGPPPGTSLADPSAPSEAIEEDTGHIKKEGSHG